MMLANTKGQDLVSHLKATAQVARSMAQYLGLSKEIEDKVYVSGLLHDIGKVVPSFQKYMKKCTSTTEVLIVDDSFQDDVTGFPLHHEIGWAYLTTKIGDDRILNAVYWHHSRPIHPNGKKTKTYDTADEVCVCLDPKDIAALDKLWQLLLPLIPADLIGNTKRGNIDVPDLFDKDGSYNRNDNAEFMLVRACVISADRHVSSLAASSVDQLKASEGLCNKEVAELVSGGIQGTTIKPSGYGQDRFDLQVGIVASVGDERTSIVKAPAGLGKTLIGILWSKMRQGRVLWVCPRNVVADAVYENIIREVELLGLSCTVELYRTGQRQRTNREDGRPEFSSDIIVTNIDAVMSPMVNNKVAGRLFTVYGTHVVLDEFHEFVSDAPLFAAFVTYMRARHRVASHCKTLLLSATPTLVQILWDTDDRKTLILPDELTHYPPQHAGTYQIDFSIIFPSVAAPGSLLVCNSVSEAQNNYRVGGYTHVVHHRYTDKDRASKEAAIKASFGKGMGGVVAGESLSAALVVQAAMDISFRELYDSVCSPESTLQRIGRTDRWGTFQSLSPSIHFMSIEERTEMGAIRTVYDTTLSSLWYKFLKQSLMGITSVDLVKLYEIYNSFYQTYRKELRAYLMEQYRIGMNGLKKGMEFLALVKFEPIKLLNHDPDKVRDKASCKNLRNPDGSYFYTVEIVGSKNVWLPPDDVLSEGHELYARYAGNDALCAGLRTSGKMLTRLKGLVACGYTAWTRQSKGKVKLPGNPLDWFKKARDPETPLPDFSRKYDPVLGVIKK
jgi:CRISPR-associated endonuclease/helicase Cas3